MKFYITTPLYYINAEPHIGHSYTNIAADCLARYMRQLYGEESVYLLTGTDEHGQKIKKAAQQAGKDPKEFADTVVEQFKHLWKVLDISYNDFIRTTEQRHINTVKRVLEILYRKGDIYLAKYEGWYCTPCETFWPSSQVSKEQCPDCQRPVERVKEKNYFFRLSKYQDWLINHIHTHPCFIRPSVRSREILSFLQQPLTDLCISRPRERLSWGIELPFDSSYVTYVWFDALINYISAVGTFDSQDRYHSHWWPADLHLVGKDILRQHAIYWPIMLYALGIEPPKTIFAHGWWLMGKDKMSKSRGNIISPYTIVERFGVDVYRYFLLKDVPFGQDGHFSEEAVIKRFNSDLANDLGNLVHRTLSMIEKYLEGKPPKERECRDREETEIERKIENLPSQIRNSLSAENDFNFAFALEQIWELVNMANKFIEETKPWILLKEKKTEKLERFLFLLLKAIKKIAESLQAFMPQTARVILEHLEKEEIKKGKALFPRIR